MTAAVPDSLKQSLADRYRIERGLGADGMATVGDDGAVHAAR